MPTSRPPVQTVPRMTVRRVARLAAALACALLLPAALWAQSGAPAPSPYAGQESRPIKAFSEADLQALRNGEGWGLAKPAELNGVPGPAHLLELRDDIPLTAHQVHRLQQLFADMNARAREQGAQLIALEAELDAAFAQGQMTPERLRALLGRIEAVRAELRYVHLATHLETPAILNAGQIARYNVLRGYAQPAGAAQAAPGGGASGHGGHGAHQGHR